MFADYVYIYLSIYLLYYYTKILIKFGSYVHRSKVSQVCSNQLCMTYFKRWKEYR